MTLRELKIENAKVKIAMQNSKSKDSKQYMFIFCMSGIPPSAENPSYFPSHKGSATR